MNLEARRFPRWTRRILRDHGFSKENTIAVVVTCRDEICSPLLSWVERCWGEAFDGRSLAGMAWLGRTGLSAALAHAPTEGGRVRIVVVHLAHIGMDPTPGLTCRGDLCVPTCGALAKLADEVDFDGTIKISDPEQTLLKLRIGQLYQKGTPRPETLEGLTQLAQLIGFTDLQVQLRELAQPMACDYALFSGILEHHPDMHRVVLKHARAMVAGESIQLLDEPDS